MLDRLDSGKPRQVIKTNLGGKKREKRQSGSDAETVEIRYTSCVFRKEIKQINTYKTYNKYLFSEIKTKSSIRARRFADSTTSSSSDGQHGHF